MKKINLIIIILFFSGFRFAIGQSSGYITLPGAGSKLVSDRKDLISTNEDKDNNPNNNRSVNSVCTMVTTAFVANHVSCYGDTDGLAKVTVTGGRLPYTYLWSPNNSSIYLASGLTAGTYTVIVTDHNGCNSIHTVTVTQPTALRDSVGWTNTSCYGGLGAASIGVRGGTPPYTFVWSPSVSTTATATGLIARGYVVLVKDAHGCFNDLFFSITQPPSIRDSMVISATQNELCNRASTGSATVGVKYGTLPYTYSWSPNVSSTAIANGVSAGTYTVTVKDQCGNSVSATVTITQPNHLRDSIVAGGTCMHELGNYTVGVKGGTSPYTYSWTPGGGTSANMTALPLGTYTITVTDRNGCTVSIICSVKCGATEVLPENNSSDCCPGLKENVSVYPNPNTGKFTMQFPVNSSQSQRDQVGFSVEVYNMLGQKIFSQFNIQHSTSNIDLSSGPPGIYFYRVLKVNGDLVGNGKIVIQK